MAWPALSTAVSPWAAQAQCLAPCGRVVRDLRTTKPAPPAVTQTASATPTPAAEDMYGVAARFNRLYYADTIPQRIAELVGFDRAQKMIMPGAFDGSLARCGVGRVRGSVRFEFGHDDETKTCSTISGALKLVADDDALYFFVRGDTRDGADTIRRAKQLGHREISVCYAPTQFQGFRDEHGPVLVVFEALLVEVSLVKAGACPETCVKFA